VNEQLKPWQPLPAFHCRRCTAQAVRRVSVPDSEVGAAIPIQRLACETHAWDLAVELSDRHGWADSMPLRMTWRYWLETRLYAAWKRVTR
jgi:hypothetical protein